MVIVRTLPLTTVAVVLPKYYYTGITLQRKLSYTTGIYRIFLE